MDRNVERRFKMGQDELALLAAYDVLLPEIALLGRQRTVVICRKNFGIGTEFFQSF
jgi:hypothetical protein